MNIEEREELLSTFKEILRITDREHNLWSKAKKLIQKDELIPITEEGLKELGYEWSIQHQAYHKEGFDYVVDFYPTYPNEEGSVGFLNKFHRSGEKLIKVKYLHQIQNIQYVLTDIHTLSN